MANEQERRQAEEDERRVARAQRAFGTLAIGDAIAKVRAIVGLPKVPDSEKAAQAALDKLRKGRERPTATELSALEFVLRMMRPAPLSTRGVLDPLPSKPGQTTYQPAVSQAWDGFRERLKPLVYSVGRLDRTTGQNKETGTGFLIGDGLVATNHHVLSQLSHGTDVLEPGMAVIRFYQEFDGDELVPECRVTGVAGVHPTLDIAVLTVDVPDARPSVELETGAVAANSSVSTLGYPYKDARNPLFTDAIYQGRYGVKRGALGELIGSTALFVYHDCSTLGGNSGSPVFSLDTGRVVGLHFSGGFMYRNEAVASAAVAEFLHASGIN